MRTTCLALMLSSLAAAQPCTPVRSIEVQVGWPTTTLTSYLAARCQSVTYPDVRVPPENPHRELWHMEGSNLGPAPAVGLALGLFALTGGPEEWRTVRGPPVTVSETSARRPAEAHIDLGSGLPVLLTTNAQVTLTDTELLSFHSDEIEIDGDAVELDTVTLSRLASAQACARTLNAPRRDPATLSSHELVLALGDAARCSEARVKEAELPYTSLLLESERRGRPAGTHAPMSGK